MESGGAASLCNLSVADMLGDLPRIICIPLMPLNVMLGDLYQSCNRLNRLNLYRFHRYTFIDLSLSHLTKLK